jgi:hypothetical protein
LHITIGFPGIISFKHEGIIFLAHKPVNDQIAVLRMDEGIYLTDRRTLLQRY